MALKDIRIQFDMFTSSCTKSIQNLHVRVPVLIEF